MAALGSKLPSGLRSAQGRARAFLRGRVIRTGWDEGKGGAVTWLVEHR